MYTITQMLGGWGVAKDGKVILGPFYPVFAQRLADGYNALLQK